MFHTERCTCAHTSVAEGSLASCAIASANICAESPLRTNAWDATHNQTRAAKHPTESEIPIRNGRTSFRAATTLLSALRSHAPIISHRTRRARWRLATLSSPCEHCCSDRSKVCKKRHREKVCQHTMSCQRFQLRAKMEQYMNGIASSRVVTMIIAISVKLQPITPTIRYASYQLDRRRRARKRVLGNVKFCFKAQIKTQCQLFF